METLSETISGSTTRPVVGGGVGGMAQLEAEDPSVTLCRFTYLLIILGANNILSSLAAVKIQLPPSPPDRQLGVVIVGGRDQQVVDVMLFTVNNPLTAEVLHC